MNLDSGVIAIIIAVLSVIFNAGIYAATVKNLREDVDALRTETAKLTDILTSAAVMNNRIATIENRFDSTDIRLNQLSQRTHDLAKDIFHQVIRREGS